MALVPRRRLLQERPDREESDYYVLSSANISETYTVDFRRPSIACSLAPPLVLLEYKRSEVSQQLAFNRLLEYAPRWAPLCGFNAVVDIVDAVECPE